MTWWQGLLFSAGCYVLLALFRWWLSRRLAKVRLDAHIGQAIAMVGDSSPHVLPAPELIARLRAGMPLGHPESLTAELEFVDEESLGALARELPEFNEEDS